MIFSEQKIEIRRAIMRLAVSKTAYVAIGGSTADEITEFARKCAKAQSREIVAEAEPGRVRILEVEAIKRPPGRPKASAADLKYPFAGLELGGSVLIDLPRSEHDKVRSAVSAWSRRRDCKFSCSAEGSAIRVTRTA